MKNKDRFFHIQHPLNKSSMTVFTRVTKPVVFCGFAFSHPKKDIYRRKQGNLIAQERATCLIHAPDRHNAKACADNFTGHSGDALIRIFNEGRIEKPTMWNKIELYFDAENRIIRARTKNS